MKPTRIISILWIVIAIAVYAAAAQDWYAAIQPIAGLQRVVATGLESFPILSALPWLALLCLALVWYFGVVGRILIAALTALLSLAGAGQLLIEQQNPQVIVSKIEKVTGIAQSASEIMARTEILWPKFLTILLLVLLAGISIAAMLSAKKFRRRKVTKEQVTKFEPEDHRSSNQTLWDNQSE